MTPLTGKGLPVLVYLPLPGASGKVRKRIAHVISTRGMGGAERFLAALVVAAERRGWEQVVLNPFASEAFGALRDLCRPVPCRARACDRLVQLPQLRRWLHRELAAFDADIVHVMLFQALVLTATLPRSSSRSRLLTHVYGGRAHLSRHGRITQELDRWASSRFDHVVAISEAVRQFLLTAYRLSPDRVSVIPLGWQGTPLPPKRDHGTPTVISVGALRPEKGHDVLLRAFSLVRAEVPRARLVLVGEGQLRPSLEAQAAALGVADAVQFLGGVPDVWAELARGDVFAIASRSEAFGIAIAEAMAAGLPVVATDVGAIPELVRPDVTGRLFPPEDHVSLAAHLRELLVSPELRAGLGAAARVAADSRRMETAIERYFDVFEELRRSREQGRAELRRP